MDRSYCTLRASLDRFFDAYCTVCTCVYIHCTCICSLTQYSRGSSSAAFEGIDVDSISLKFYHETAVLGGVCRYYMHISTYKYTYIHVHTCV